MTTLEGKTLFITGASRGIGLAIGLRAARDGANVAVVAKTAEPHPKLKGTVHSAAADIEAAGGRALPVVCDIRFEDQVAAAVARTAEAFGGIDICVNNASAIAFGPLAVTDIKRFDLMQAVNTRGTFIVSKACIPHLRQAENPHILMLSPPLDMQPRWFAGHIAYTIAKYGMSQIVLGLAEELREAGIAVNALWPRSTIATAAIENLIGEKLMRMSRRPDILADAAHLLLTQPADALTGQFLIDDSFLSEVGGVDDFARYSVEPGQPLAPDFFVPADSLPPPGVEMARVSMLK